jgi:hypothetical protein
MISIDYKNFPFRFKDKILLKVSSRVLDELNIEYPYYIVEFPYIIIVSNDSVNTPLQIQITDNIYKL